MRIRTDRNADTNAPRNSSAHETERYIQLDHLKVMFVKPYLQILYCKDRNVTNEQRLRRTVTLRVFWSLSGREQMRPEYGPALAYSHEHWDTSRPLRFRP